MMVGIYFSGTGNTRHCVETFLKACGDGEAAFSMEDPRAVLEIQKHDEVLLAYPVYFSNAPKIVLDFLQKNGPCFRGKRVFIIATMGLFSGDGTGCTARTLKRCGADILGGLHLKMPDCIGDVKALKKSREDNRRLIQAADAKIAEAVSLLKVGRPPLDGLGFLAHTAGLLGQRLWFYGKTARYSSKLKINRTKCTGCGKCTALCPMQNLRILEGKAAAQGRCTMCYRCIGNCPQQAITLLGKELVEQYTYERCVQD